MKQAWRPFEEARAFIRTLGLQGVKAWKAYCKSGARPADIPAHPDLAYGGQFQGIEDWLGAARRLPPRNAWRPFEEARAFARSLGLRSASEWAAYAASGERPGDIPTHPARIYAGEFVSMGDWLGTGTVSNRGRVYRSYPAARAFVRDLHLNNVCAWRTYCASGQKPADIPANPRSAYAGEFQGFDDWLGTGRRRPGRDFLPFEAARAFVRALGLTNKTEWQVYSRSQLCPRTIPANPWTVYAGEYLDIEDWLGCPSEAYRRFEEARAFVCALGLTGQKQWAAYCASGQKPADIPANPQRVYAREFVNWSDWLGTGRRRPGRDFLPFEAARAFVRALGLKNGEEWVAYCHSGNCPTNIPASPHKFYAGEFVSMGDWLGTGTVANGLRPFRPFQEARAFVRALGLKNQAAWVAYCRSGRKPEDIPSQPAKVYRDQYQNLGDWLGTGTIAFHKRSYLPFEEARAFVRALGLKSSEEWDAYCRSGTRPPHIPSNPHHTYRGQFVSMGDWLGTGYVATSQRAFRPFEEARAFARTLGLLSHKEWQAFCASARKPTDIPAKPEQVYRGQFVSWGDWLGTGTVSSRLREFLPFEQARAFVRSLGLQNQKEWDDYRRAGHKPANIPAQPAVVYQGQYRGMADWLGAFNTWQKAAMLALLEDLRPHLVDLEERELYIILQQAGALPALRLALGGVSPLQVLRDLVECNGEGIERALRMREADDLVAGANADQAEELLTDSDLAELDSAHFFDSDGSLDQGEPPAVPATRSSLDVLDALTRQGSAWLGDEAAEYLIGNRVNLLWERYMSEGREVVEAVQKSEGGVFFSEIRRRFLAEVCEMEALSLPHGWSFRDATGTPVPPNAMQRRTAWLVRKLRCVGNWSGTGAGKTLAAILASRVCQARLTLVITNYATIEGWRRQILAAYPDSAVLYEVPATCAPHSYLVLNYEQFQTRSRHQLVDELAALGPDLLVFDEVQLVKQRDARASLRRQALETLVERLAERNPDLRVLGMSATPVINNLVEAKKLLELITGTSFSEDVKATVHNALAMHRLLMRHGFRFRPRYEQELRTHTPVAVRNDLLAPLLEAHTSILAIEQLLLPAKLEAIRPCLRPGTLIYTHYVEGMIEPICQFLSGLGFSVGRYTGEDKVGLAPFLGGQIDVLVGSSPVGLGVDGLQQVCDRVIILSLPWTGAAYEQVIGRVRRQGSRYGSVEIIVPQVMLEAGQASWSWDAGRMEVIQYKRTLSDCAIDGHIPETVRLRETLLLQRSREALERWIAQAGGGEVREKEAVRQ